MYSNSMNSDINNNGGVLLSATFAGGCFWCIEAPFRNSSGVESVVSGYMGGEIPSRTYELTGHREVVQLSYDPARITYKELLDIFWRQIDPTDEGGSFYDRGDQYKTAIYYHTEEQLRQAELSKKDLEESGRFTKPIVTEILSATIFYPAEIEHQNYARKNPERYYSYRTNSGRDEFLKSAWGDEK